MGQSSTSIEKAILPNLFLYDNVGQSVSWSVMALLFSRDEATLYEGVSVRPSDGRMDGRMVGQMVGNLFFLNAKNG